MYTFDKIKTELESIPAPAQRVGIFNLSVWNHGRYYRFCGLKQSKTYNPDNFGFSLNHYMQIPELPKPKWNRSRFHDSEGVDVCITRDEFQKAQKLSIGLYRINCKHFSLIIEIKK